MELPGMPGGMGMDPAAMMQGMADEAAPTTKKPVKKAMKKKAKKTMKKKVMKKKMK